MAEGRFSARRSALQPLRSLPMTFMISCRGSALAPCGDPRLFGRRERRNEICDAAPRDGKGADPGQRRNSDPSGRKSGRSCAISHRDRIQDRHAALPQNQPSAKKNARNARPDGERSEHSRLRVLRKVHDADAGGLRNKGHDARVPHEDDRGKHPERPAGDPSRRSFRRAERAPGGIGSGRRRIFWKAFWIHMNDTPGVTLRSRRGCRFFYFALRVGAALCLSIRRSPSRRRCGLPPCAAGGERRERSLSSISSAGEAARRGIARRCLRDEL